eukprot:SAG31_NODE_2402_length_5767_cov_4.440543_2_plen_1704_part_00
MQELLGRRELALGDYNAAIGIESDHLDALLRRGRLLTRLGRYEQATADLQQVLGHPRRTAHMNNDAQKLLDDMEIMQEMEGVEPMGKVASLCQSAATSSASVARNRLEQWVARACDSEHGIWLAQLLESCDCWRPQQQTFLYWPQPARTLQMIETAARRLSTLESPNDGADVLQAILHPQSTRGDDTVDGTADAGAVVASATSAVPPTYRLTVGDEVRLKVGVSKPGSVLTTREDIGEIIQDDFDNIPYRIRAKTGPKQGVAPGFFYETDVELADMTIVRDQRWCATRNQYCSAGKKKKDGGITSNTTSITTAATPAQRVHLEEAVRLYSACLDSELANDYLCHVWRAECRLKLGATEDALADVDAAISADPERIDAYKCRAMCHMHLEKWEEAKTDAMKILEIDPKDYGATTIRNQTIQKLFGTGMTDAAATSAVATTYYSSSAGAKSDSGFVGLSNQGATCYLNSLIQSLYMTPELRLGVYNWVYDAAKYEPMDQCIPAQLQRLFVELQTSNARAVDTRALTKSFGWNSSDAFQQQDVQELFNLLFEALETKFQKTPQAGIIKALYEGQMKDYVRCKECNTERHTTATFKDIMLAIKPFGCTEAIESVQDGLSKYFEAEVMDGGNQVHCEHCKKKTDSSKGLGLLKAPYVFCVQLKRFEYNWQFDRREKLNDCVPFDEVINLGQYMDEADASMQDAASEPATETEESTRKHDSAATPASGFGKDGGTILSRGISAVVQGKLEYALYAILVHSGGAIGGHYFAYVKDFATGKWLEFNDSNISELPDEGIRRAYGGTATSAYMLMYRRIDSDLNIDEVGKTHLPTGLNEALQAEKDAKEQREREEREAREAKARLYTLTVVDPQRNQVQNFPVDKTCTVKEVREKIALVMGLSAELEAGDLRLRVFDQASNMCKRVIDDPDDNELHTCQNVYNLTWIAVETKNPDVTTWLPAIHGEDEPSVYYTYQQPYVFKLFLYDDAATSHDEWLIPDSGVDVMFRSGAVLGDIRAAARENFGLAETADIVLVRRGANMSFVSRNSLVSVSDVLGIRQSGITTGDFIFVRTTDSGSASLDTESMLEAASDDVYSRIYVHFTEVGGDKPTKNITIRKGLSINELRDRLAEELQVSAITFEMFQNKDSAVGLSYMPLQRRLMLYLRPTVTKTREVPFYVYRTNIDDSVYLFDIDIDENIPVPDLRKKLATQLSERAGVKSINDSRIRVREIGFSVMRDDQTALNAVRVFNGSEKFGLSFVPGPSESKTTANEAVVTCVRFYPATHTYGEIGEVLVLPTQTCDSFRERLAAHTGIPAERIGLLKKAYSMTSIIHVATSPDWDTDKVPFKTNYYGHQIVTEKTLRGCRDADVWYFRDNDEPMGELTDEQKAAIEAKEKKVVTTGRSQYRRAETGVKMNIASAAVNDSEPEPEEGTETEKGPVVEPQAMVTEEARKVLASALATADEWKDRAHTCQVEKEIEEVKRETEAVKQQINGSQIDASEASRTSGVAAAAASREVVDADDDAPPPLIDAWTECDDVAPVRTMPHSDLRGGPTAVVAPMPMIQEQTSEQDLEQMLALGFSRAHCVEALRVRSTVQEAVEYLFSTQNDLSAGGGYNADDEGDLSRTNSFQNPNYGYEMDDIDETPDEPMYDDHSNLHVGALAERVIDSRWYPCRITRVHSQGPYCFYDIIYVDDNHEEASVEEGEIRRPCDML